MPLSSTITAFATHDSLTVTRHAVAPTWSDGVATPAAASTLTLTNPCVQPASGRDLKTAPEGHHVEDLLVVYTDVRLLAKPEPDVIAIDWPVGSAPENFAVVKVEGPWMISGSVHFRAWCARQVTP